MPPLDGIRVVDIASEAGAYCTKLLADLGAQVIKVEAPEGSPERSIPPFMNCEPTTSLHYLHFHRGKQSVVIDSHEASGQELFSKLIQSTDILVEDRSMAGFERDYKVLRSLNHGLIQASISGFGSSGPRSSWKGSDLVGQATGGLMFRMGFPEDPPNSMGEGFAYHQSSAHAACGILVALARRDQSGYGQLVDVSLQEGMALMQYDAMPMYVTKQVVMKRAGHGQGSSGKRYRRIWNCRTGRVRFQLVSQSSEREWPLLIDWLDSRGFGDELRATRWSSSEARQAGLVELESIFDRFFRTVDSRTLMHEAQDRGIMLMAFNDVSELGRDPQLSGEGFFCNFTRAGLAFTDAGPPYRFAQGLANDNSLARPGDHTALLQIEPEKKPAPISASRESRGPLAGLRVVDFTWVIAGPLHTKWMAAFGAEVIKIERFKKGAALNRGNMSPDSVIGFNNLNVGKRSLAVDLSFEKSRKTLETLIAQSDIVVDNFGPDVLPNWGFTPDRLEQINPSIITMSMPALGKTGPHRLYKGLGSYFQARAGLDGLVGYPHRDITDVGFAYADTTCNAAHALIAVLAAIHHRNTTGRGEHIEMRQLESSINYLGAAVLEYSANSTEQVRMGSRSRSLAPQGIYPCREDDTWCVMSVGTQAEWVTLCRIIGQDEWMNDPRFATVADRIAAHDEIDAGITRWTSSKSKGEAADELQQAGIAAGAVLDAGELIDADPQMAHRKFYRRFANGGMVEAVPFLLSQDASSITDYVPELGEHTRVILSEVLGLSDAEIAELLDIGAFGGT